MVACPLAVLDCYLFCELDASGGRCRLQRFIDSGLGSFRFWLVLLVLLIASLHLHAALQDGAVFHADPLDDHIAGNRAFAADIDTANWVHQTTLQDEWDHDGVIEMIHKPVGHARHL